MNPERPFQRSYWAVPSKLIGGCYPGDIDAGQMEAKLTGLAKAGVTLVVNLMEETEVNRNGQSFVDYGPILDHLVAEKHRVIRRERFPIRDMSIPTNVGMRTILDAIHHEIDEGGVVYVHCWGGRGRTGTVVGCYLLESQMETADTVLERLRKLTDHAPGHFQPTPQTTEQRDFVLAWKGTR